MMFTMVEVQRSGRVYLECMSQCLLLGPLRDNLEAVGLPWRLGLFGMYVLVDPAVYDDVVAAVRQTIELDMGGRVQALPPRQHHSDCCPKETF